MNEKLKKGERVAKLNVGVNFALSVIKFAVAWVSGSVALLADSLNTFSDIFSALAVVFGLQFAQRKPDEKFPYGYYKAETLASLLVAIFIIATGLEILSEGIAKTISPRIIELGLPVVATSLLSAVTLYWLAKLKEKTGKEIDSLSLVNEGRHSMADVLASLAVGIGVLSSQAGFAQGEGIVAVIISMVVLKTGLEQVWSSVLVLMDASVSKELNAKAKSIALATDGVREVHDMKLRRSGPFILGEMNLGVSSALKMEKAHGISERVENSLKNKMPQIDSIIIHLEPSIQGMLRVAMPVESENGLQSIVAGQLGSTPFFIFVDVEDGRVVSSFTEKNPAMGKEKRKGIEIVGFLSDHKVEALISPPVGTGPFNELVNREIAVYEKIDGSASENLNRFFAGKLKKLRKAKRK